MPSEPQQPQSGNVNISGADGQRNYGEHIVRNEADLVRIQDYIVTNPRRWELDQLHPNNPSKW